MKGKSICLALALGGLLLLGAGADSRAAEPTEIGVVHFGIAELDGALRSTGDVLLNRELVRTGQAQAMVHLDNGQVLRFEANSAARFESVSYDEIRVTVFAGRVTKWSAEGRLLTAGAGSRFTIGGTLQDPLAAEGALLREAADAEQSRSARRMGR